MALGTKAIKLFNSSIFSRDLKLQHLTTSMNQVKRNYNTYIHKLEIRDSQNLAKLGLGGRPSLFVL